MREASPLILKGVILRAFKTTSRASRYADALELDGLAQDLANLADELGKLARDPSLPAQTPRAAPPHCA